MASWHIGLPPSPGFWVYHLEDVSSMFCSHVQPAVPSFTVDIWKPHHNSLLEKTFARLLSCGAVFHAISSEDQSNLSRLSSFCRLGTNFDHRRPLTTHDPLKPQAHVHITLTLAGPA